MAEPRVSILMGSDSDFPVMKEAAEALKGLGIAFDIRVLSAHRTPEETARYVAQAPSEGTQVFIAGAGLAAHLPGVVAAFTHLPVIGVPLASGPLQGQDSLLAIAQMPPGIPVATVAINGAKNAGILAAQIMACGNSQIAERLKASRAEMREKVLSKTLPSV